MWSDREKKLEKRKENLGEKFTSDWTWRKFSTKQLRLLNATIDFDSVYTIYEIGWCNGQDKYFLLLMKYIGDNEINKIEQLNKTIEFGQDEFGQVPIGDYLKTFIWTMKNQQTFIQIIKGSFDKTLEQICFQREISIIDVKTFDKRKLIYPVD